MILTFSTVRQVIKADQILSGAKIKSKIIPIPENISSECGMCIETDVQKWEEIKQLLIDFNMSRSL